MKAINLFYIYLLILLFSACSKDQGNYDYVDVNKMTILDTAGDTLTGQEFDINGGDTVVVEAVAKGTLSGFNPSDVQHTWVLDKDTIGKGAKFYLTVDKFQPGPNRVKLYSVDPLTKLSYLNSITVNVNATISKGIAVLAKDEQNNSILYLKSTKNQSGKWFRFTSLGKDNQYPLGKDPISVDFEGGYMVYPNFTIVSKDATFPIMLVNLSSMEPYFMINGKNKALKGGDLKPTFFKMGYGAQNGDSYILEEGKVRYLKNGFLGPDVLTAKRDYDFGENAISYDNFVSIRNAGRFVMGFDKISKRILFFQNKGFTFFIFPSIAEDKSTEVLGDMDFVGAGGDMFSSSGGLRYGMILRKGNQVYNYNTGYEYNTETKVYEFSKITEAANANIPNIDKAINLRLNSWTSFYYYALGRTIYRFPFFSLTVQPYFTLPEDGTGDIVYWNFDKDASSNSHDNMGIATYNPNAKEEKKGSFYHYEITPDASGKPMTLKSKSLYQIDKAVSISMGIQ